MLGLGLGLFRRTNAGGGPSGYSFVNTEASTYVAAMSVQPDDTRKALIDAYVGALKTAGIWAALDILYLTAAHNAQAARLNLKSPATFVLADIGGGPSFQVDRGFTGNGTSTQLDTQWVPSTNGVNYVQDSASVWVWSLTNAQSSLSVVGNSSDPRGTFVLRNTSDGTTLRLNDATLAGMNGSSSLTSLGLFGGQRRGATDKRTWRNGSQLGSTAATASTGLATQSQRVCGAITVFNPYQIAFCAWGAALTNLESAFYAATLTYMQGVGAA